MAVMFGWNLTEVSVLGSQVFGQALVQNCGYPPFEKETFYGTFGT